MVKTVGPLLSLDAHGSIADTLTFSHRKSGKQVRAYNKPLKVPTAKQRGQRRLTEFLVAHWQNMSDATKATWATKAKASGLNIAGYHYFLREAQRDLYTHHGLCGYWHCNEIVGGKVLDLSGNAIHGTLEPGYPANAPSLVDSYKTKFSKALLYDGVDEYVDCGHNVIFNITAAITIIAWMEISDLSKRQELVDKGRWISSEENSGFTLRFENNNHFYFMVFNDAKDSVDSALAYTAGWYMVVGTWILGTQSLYVNGVKKSEATALPSIKTNTRDLTLGATSLAGNFFGGKSDEICIYNRVLSEAEIATRYKFALREAS